MKTVRPKFGELKMQAVFTRKNMRLSRLYDRKFSQSRFCNLNLLSKRFKFRVKFHNENRWQVLLVDVNL